jgi:hypothetical protein
MSGKTPYSPINQINVFGGGALAEIIFNSFPGNSTVQPVMKPAGPSVALRICASDKIIEIDHSNLGVLRGRSFSYCS